MYIWKFNYICIKISLNKKKIFLCMVNLSHYMIWNKTFWDFTDWLKCISIFFLVIYVTNTKNDVGTNETSLQLIHNKILIQYLRWYFKLCSRYERTNLFLLDQWTLICQKSSASNDSVYTWRIQENHNSTSGIR